MADKPLRLSFDKATHKDGWYTDIINRMNAAESGLEAVTAAAIRSTVEQPISQIPDLSDANLEAAWLNREVVGTGNDLVTVGSTNDYSMAEVGTVPFGDKLGAGPFSLDNYLRLAIADWQIGDGTGSITAWCKREAGPQILAANNTIFASSGETVNNDEFLFMIGNNNITLQVDSTTILQGSVDLSTLEEWFHLCVTSNGSRTLFYVNGINDPTIDFLGMDSGEWLDTTPNRDNITIGVWHRNLGPTFGPFEGLLRDVRYYSREITQTEVAAQCLWLSDFN